jgi:tetratricopeptide (TPR) repeat protein
MNRVVFIVLSIAFALVACNGDKKAVDTEWKLYESSLENGDASTAIVALNRILVFEEFNASALDSLAILYFRAGSDNACVKVGKRALNIRQSDAVERVMGKANKNLGQFEQAEIYFKKQLEKNPEDLSLLHDMAFTQINLNKANEAVPYIQRMIKHPNSGSEVMKEFYQNGSQLVPYRAVAFNMLGFLQANAGQKEAATQSYEAALQLFPKYALAQNNLRVLKEKN